jgi:hypothetical protein
MVKPLGVSFWPADLLSRPYRPHELRVTDGKTLSRPTVIRNSGDPIAATFVFVAMHAQPTILPYDCA